MKQEIIYKFERQNLLTQFIGRQWDEDVIKESRKIIVERKAKWCALTGKMPSRDFSIIFTHDVDKKRILGISHSIPNDLLLDNFGNLLCSLINNNGSPGGNPLQTVIDDTGAPQTIYTSGQILAKMFNGNPWGTEIRLGLGNTPPSFGDYGIETPCLNAPESTYFVTGATAGYTPGTGEINMTGTCGAFGAAEIITESVVSFGGIFNSAGVAKNIIMARYVYGTALPVLLGKSATVDNVWSV